MSPDDKPLPPETPEFLFDPELEQMLGKSKHAFPSIGGKRRYKTFFVSEEEKLAVDAFLAIIRQEKRLGE